MSSYYPSICKRQCPSLYLRLGLVFDHSVAKFKMEHDRTWKVRTPKGISCWKWRLGSQKHSQLPSSRSSIYSSIHPHPILSHPIPSIIPDHFRSFQIHFHSIGGQHKMRLWLGKQWYHGRSNNASVTSLILTRHGFNMFQQGFMSKKFKHVHRDIWVLSGIVPKNMVIWGRIPHLRHTRFQVDVLLGAIHVCFLSSWCRNAVWSLSRSQ